VYVNVTLSECRTKRGIKTANRSSEDAAKFKMSGNNTNRSNCLQEEIKGRLNSGTACYHSVQSLLSSHLLSRNVRLEYMKHNSASCFV
jgi:hypothetical protein